MNTRLNEILSAINGLYTYDDDIARHYISLINEAIDLLRGLETHPTSLLDNAKNEALTELSNELNNRMDENFFHAPFERRKNDFKISKMLVGVSIGNVISEMMPAE